MKLSKAYKAANYDAVQVFADKQALAVHDLVNDKFSKAIKITAEDYDHSEIGHLTLKVSVRAMPLFLAEWFDDSGSRYNTYVYTESELDNISREADATAQMMLRDAFYRLKREHYPKAA